MNAPLPFRVGHGYDIHRLQPGGKLLLGSVMVAEDISPVAHSDGDVVIHALVDALLGAIAAGDIGEHFPNSEPQWKGAPSVVFLEHAMKLVGEAGYRVGNVDLLIVAERPRLRKFKPEMKRTLARLLGVGEGELNVKAGTNEGCDSLGRGEAIAADATVLLVRAQ